jgi:hypothetical protein
LFSPNDECPSPDEQRLDNLEFEEHKNVIIQDIKELPSGASIDDCGFQVLSHSSKISQFNTATDIDDYRRETEALLKEELKAEYVHCYDSRLRKNLTFQHTHIDLNDPLVVEFPARGVHNGMLSKSSDVPLVRRSMLMQINRPNVRVGITGGNCMQLGLDVFVVVGSSS